MKDPECSADVVRCGYGNTVQVLGTLISEWDDGKAKCEALLETEATAQQAARQLAAIAAYFEFDGWLLNIENELDTALMPNLLLFIRQVPAVSSCSLLWPSYMLGALPTKCITPCAARPKAILLALMPDIGWLRRRVCDGGAQV